MVDIPDDLIAAKQQAEPDLLARPEVTGVSVGLFKTDSEVTGQLCVRVYVTGEDTPGQDPLPEDIGGYPVCVLQSIPQLQSDNAPYRPLIGGGSIEPCRTHATQGIAIGGTLGAIVYDATSGDPRALSCWHVLCVDAGAVEGEPIAQPALAAGGTCPNDVVGTLAPYPEPGSDGMPAPGTPTVDAAVCIVDTSIGANPEIADIGAVAGTADVSLADTVRRRGWQSGPAVGLVGGKHGTHFVDYRKPPHSYGLRMFVEVIEIDVDTFHSAFWSQRGDSGSVLVNDQNQIVGLHFAGNDVTGNPDNQSTVGYANPITDVFTVLNLTI
jgi:hypothetical protein